jgi:hypothetical protein
MTAPVLMETHPPDETLAAFVDDKLPKTERRAVIAHLAECGECRTLVNDISDIKAMEEAANVVEMPKRGGWRVAAASFAVAAGLLVVFGPSIRVWAFGRSVKEITAESVAMAFRPSVGRLSVPLPYQKVKETPRGAQEEPEAIVEGVPPEIYIALDDLHKAKRPDPHAVGLAHLMATQYDDAIPYLEQAAATNERAKIDLAAALLARGRDSDYQRALELSQTSNTPEALWNRAVAVEQIRGNDDDDAAIAAWNAYLKVESSSPWAEEARRNIQALELYKVPVTK